jgi:phytoene desaturase
MNAMPHAIAAAADKRPHAIVIGAGLGGLAAAARLGRRGYRVTVLERLDQPGGRARMFRQDGFSFDAGPTIVTAPYVLDELWSFCGRRLSDDVNLVPMKPFYRLRFADGSTFDTTADTQAMREQIRRMAPGDVEGYDRFLKTSRRLFHVGFEEMGGKPYGSLYDLALSMPDIVRLKGWQSLHQLVSQHVQSEKLRIALSFHPLFIGGNPYTASGIYGLIAHLEKTFGVHYAMGGTHTIVQGLVKLTEAMGGTIIYGADVDEILIEGRRVSGVRLANRERIAADIVVSNADAAWTYAKLVPAWARDRWSDRKLAKAKYSMSLFVWYFGTNRRYDEVPHHTIVLGPRYKELLDDIFDKKVLADDFSLYLHRPSATDPSVAPPGCDAFYVLSPVPNLQGDVDWAAKTESYRQAIEARLSQTILPGLKEAVVSSRVMTPVHFRDELLGLHGSAFSFSPILLQSAYFRPHNASEDVENLFLVGAGTHPGAGLPGVLNSARMLDRVTPEAYAFV